ncbi:glycosyltransferase [Sphingomonas sp.]|uniref:glycosyltransferase n=1 Tax=Sphingomonas sp. TaxID=28214 RepID=UPI00286E2EDF|nr:glycosyltransferase [Sphingomonas sp.]
MTRFARDMNVIVWEEPIVIGRRETAFVKVRQADGYPSIRIAVPHLPEGLSMPRAEAALTRLFENFAAAIRGPVVAWYYTPMMLPFSRGLEADAVIYDAMDELSKFRFAPEALLDLERELIGKADLVFTGGSSLYEAKKDRHPSVHCFPSSVDRPHFMQARSAQADPADQAKLARPRFGFYGVIDERFDLDLLDAAAKARPDRSFVMVGPVVKIAEGDLPRGANIHYLGSKTYHELPAYLSGWDVALMPFAMNPSTEFISPTKTPEYLAGGRPVVSTPVKDVVRHYGHLEGVKIAADSASFIAACDAALELSRDPAGEWLAEADLMLSATSWDTVQARMAGLVAEALGERASNDNPALLVAAE